MSMAVGSYNKITHYFVILEKLFPKLKSMITNAIGIWWKMRNNVYYFHSLIKIKNLIIYTAIFTRFKSLNLISLRR